MELCSYGGWKNTIKLSNEFVELFITLDVGPRIIRYALINDLNVFKEFPAQIGQQGEDLWMPRGGHRLWVSPENDYSYDIDNTAVNYEKIASNRVIVRHLPDFLNGWQKEIEVKLDLDTPRATVKHRIRNISDRELDKPIAAWALTVMAPGGRAIIPTPRPGPHNTYLLPNRNLVLWPYTEVQDPRFAFGPANFQIRYDVARGPLKVGTFSRTKWIAYQNGNAVFAKSTTAECGAEYPDMGVNVEVFTNPEILELETLGALKKLQPGETLEHVEKWVLFRHDEHIDTYQDISSIVEPKLGV